MTCRIRTGDWKDKTMNLEGKRVLVIGSGKSGVAAAELLRKKGITFVLFDGNKDLDVTAITSMIEHLSWEVEFHPQYQCLLWRI